MGNPFTVFTDFNPQNATQYDYQILAITSQLGATLSNIQTITTASCNIPPTITSLNITQGGSTSFSGTSRVSGNQSASGQGGSDWLNPINITLSAREGSKPITQYYVAFYNKSLVPATTPSGCGTSFEENNCLADLKNKVSDPKNGFLLRYDTNGNYYVWNTGNNVWINITTLDPSEGQPIPISGELLFRAFHSQTPQPLNSWKILFYKAFDSKEMHTAGYVVDENRLSAFSPDL